MKDEFFAHIFPGSSLLLLGFIRLIHTLHHMIKHKSSSRYQLNNAVVLNIAYFKTPIPHEGCLKIIFGILGIFVELYVWDFQFVFVQFHHITIIYVYLLSGFVDILTLKNYIPKKFDYIVFSLAFVTEAFIFNNHVFNRSLLDGYLHKLLITISIIISIVTMLLLFVDNYYIHMNLRLNQSILILLNGSWFWQIAYILFSDSFVYDLFDIESVKKVRIIFCWHIIIITTIVTIISVIMIKIVKSNEGIKHSE